VPTPLEDVPAAVGLLAWVVLGGWVLLRAGFALLSRPQRGILLLAALVPFDGLLLLVPEGGWLEPWKEILVLATFGAALVSSSSAPRQRGGRVPEWFPAAAGLVLLGVVSALVAADVRGLVGFKIDFFYLLIHSCCGCARSMPVNATTWSRFSWPPGPSPRRSVSLNS